MKIKKINKNNPVQTTIRTRKNRIGFEKLHTAGLPAGQAGKEEETAPNSFSSGFRNLYKASVLRSESTGRNIEVQKRDMKPFKAL